MERVGQGLVSLQTPGDGTGETLSVNSEDVLAAHQHLRSWALSSTPGTHPRSVDEAAPLGPFSPARLPWEVLCADSKTHIPIMCGLLQVCSPAGKSKHFEKFYLKTWEHNRGIRMQTGILLPGFSDLRSEARLGFLRLLGSRTTPHPQLWTP